MQSNIPKMEKELKGPFMVGEGIGKISVNDENANFLYYILLGTCNAGQKMFVEIS